MPFPAPPAQEGDMLKSTGDNVVVVVVVVGVSVH